MALDAGALRLLGSDASGASGADGSRERRLEEAAFRAIPAMRGGYAFHASYPVTHGPRILLLKDPLELHIFVRTDLRP